MYFVCHHQNLTAISFNCFYNMIAIKRILTITIAINAESKNTCVIFPKIWQLSDVFNN